MAIQIPFRRFLAPLRVAVVPLGFAVAAVVSVVLANQNQTLTYEVRRMRGQQRLPHIHDAVPIVPAIAVNGGTVKLGAGPDRAQILFIFNTSCRYCLENLPKWKMLATAIRGIPGVSVYGVSLDSDSSTRAYAQSHQVDYPVLRFPDKRSAGSYRAVAVPITMVVDSAGTVLYTRGSVLTSAAVDTLLGVLRAKQLMPKVTPAPRPAT